MGRSANTLRARSALTAALLLTCACGGGEADSGDGLPTPNSDPARGAKLYATYGCTTCHGGTGAGTSTAPGLAGLNAHWTRSDLADYLNDPRAWIQKSERLRELKREYSLEMPALTLPLADRLIVADHVLGFGAASE